MRCRIPVNGPKLRPLAALLTLAMIATAAGLVAGSRGHRRSARLPASAAVDVPRDFAQRLLAHHLGAMQNGSVVPDPDFDIFLGGKCLGAILGNVRRYVPKFPRLCCTIPFASHLCNEQNTEPESDPEPEPTPEPGPEPGPEPTREPEPEPIQESMPMPFD